VFKFAAFVSAVLVVALYVDFGPEADAKARYLFPTLAAAGFLYSLGLVGGVIFGCGAASFWFTDVMSDSALESVVLPLLFMGSVVAFVIWAWSVGHLRGGRSYDVGGVGSDIGGGGDGGGGC
jgi:hypothetical protein